MAGMINKLKQFHPKKGTNKSNQLRPEVVNLSNKSIEISAINHVYVSTHLNHVLDIFQIPQTAETVGVHKSKANVVKSQVDR